MAHVVRVNASKSNVLMVQVQACKSVHFIQKSISRIFSQAFCLFKISFSLITLLKNPTWEQKKTFPDSKPKLEKQKAKTRRKPTIHAIPNLCFCAGTCTMYKSCWNHSPWIGSPQSPRRRISGVRCLVPEVHMLRPHESLGFATITSLWENSPQKKPRWKPARNWRRNKNAHDSKPGGMGKASLPEQLRSTHRGMPRLTKMLVIFY